MNKSILWSLAHLQQYFSSIVSVPKSSLMQSGIQFESHVSHQLVYIVASSLWKLNFISFIVDSLLFLDHCFGWSIESLFWSIYFRPKWILLDSFIDPFLIFHFHLLSLLQVFHLLYDSLSFNRLPMLNFGSVLGNCLFPLHLLKLFFLFLLLLFLMLFFLFYLMDFCGLLTKLIQVKLPNCIFLPLLSFFLIFLFFVDFVFFCFSFLVIFPQLLELLLEFELLLPSLKLFCLSLRSFYLILNTLVYLFLNFLK